MYTQSLHCNMWYQHMLTSCVISICKVQLEIDITKEWTRTTCTCITMCACIACQTITYILCRSLRFARSIETRVGQARVILLEVNIHYIPPYILQWPWAMFICTKQLVLRVQGWNPSAQLVPTQRSLTNTEPHGFVYCV